MQLILTINPGSTSTKLGIFDGDELVLEKTIEHHAKEMRKDDSFDCQAEFREKVVLDWLKQAGFELKDFAAISARGGFTRPIPSGVYSINSAMLADLRSGTYGSYTCDLAAIIAHNLASKHGIPCYVVDPVIVDEMLPVAHLSGHPLIQRRSVFHALNQKAIARECAQKMGKRYEECHYVIAHLGGGISVGVHHKGKVIDARNAFDGEGSYTPERSGGLPATQLVNLCFSGEYTKNAITRMITGQGGVSAYLGTSDIRAVEAMIKNGDQKAAEVLDGMAYQISKDIGAYCVVAGERPDAIILTGSIARSQRVTNFIKEKIEWLAPIIIVPGEDENKALAAGAYRILTGREEALEYTPSKTYSISK